MLMPKKASCNWWGGRGQGRLKPDVSTGLGDESVLGILRCTYELGENYVVQFKSKDQLQEDFTKQLVQDN